MKVITAPTEVISSFIKKENYDESRSWSTGVFCISLDVTGGSLLYNTLSGEMVFLETGEWPCSYLASHGFIVPSGKDEQKQCDELRSTLRFVQDAKTSGFNTYTILPTSDCNARCFYCYELGCEKMTMTPADAEKVADYILRTCAKGTLKLRWFGGEPLCNSSVIDIICRHLAAGGKSFESAVVSNGYLFDEELVKKAAELWNLKNVQITLDGTEAVYNKRKAFPSDRDGAFRRVTENIRLLAEHKIKVHIRLNADNSNLKDLSMLADQLSAMYNDKGSLNVYVSPIFSADLDASEEDRARLYEGIEALESKLKSLGLRKIKPLSGGLRINNCLADNAAAVTILPDGRLHSCEHFNQNHCFGSIDSDTPRSSDLDYWRQVHAKLPECAGCAAYPQCIRPLHCPDIDAACSAQARQRTLKKIEERMLETYNSIK